MSTAAETFLALQIDARSPVPLRRQLFVELRKALLRGVLPVGTRLPSSRRLAQRLSLSRTTVVEVFEELIADGIITGRPGSGTFVASTPRREQAPPGALQPPDLSARGNRIMLTAAATARTDRLIGAFRSGLPALDAFPNEMWARHLARAARQPPIETLDYGDAAGYWPLRAAIAERLAVTRGIRCRADNVLVVAGTQQAMDFAAQLLVDVDDAVCVEDPGYVPIRSAFLAAGARLVPAPVDDDGLDVSAAELRAPRPKIIVVAPSHQFPLAVTLSAQRRTALLSWAERAQAWIIEDDFESEFRYDGRSLDALQSSDTAGRVIYVGTFSKTLFPSLRIGYVVAPTAFVGAFSALARLSGLSPKLIEQAALASLIDSGDFSQHVHRMRRLYAERQHALIEAVEKRPGAMLRLAPAASGLHLFGRLSPDVSDKSVVALAAAQNIYVEAASALSLETFCNGLILGYAVTPPDEIRNGIDILARVIERVAHDAAAEREVCCSLKVSP